MHAWLKPAKASTEKIEQSQRERESMRRNI